MAQMTHKSKNKGASRRHRTAAKYLTNFSSATKSTAYQNKK